MKSQAHGRRWLSPPQPMPHLLERIFGDGRGLLPLVAVDVAIVVSIFSWPHLIPVSLFVVPLLVAHAFLSPRDVPLYTVFTAALACLSLVALNEVTVRIVVRVLVIIAISGLVWWSAVRRGPLGVGGAKADTMFLDLLTRMQHHEVRLRAPEGWRLDTAIRAAGDTPFNGDFMVSSRSEAALQLALVDVSGKGTEAGVRALQLSGAMAGLIEALPPDRFLAAANDYLISQDWEEGFATAVHVCVDVRDGSFQVRSAGHLPPLILSAEQGPWEAVPEPSPDQGPALGLVADAAYPAASGRLRHGEVMVLYTDGVVERAREHIDRGIDRLLAQAACELGAGEQGVAERLIEACPPEDDRALVLLRRD